MSRSGDSDGVLRLSPSVPVDLRGDGVLWLVNRVVFHPRGFALGADPDGSLRLFGDGSEPWNYAESMHDGEDERFCLVEALLARAVINNVESGRGER